MFCAQKAVAGRAPTKHENSIQTKALSYFHYVHTYNIYNIYNTYNIYNIYIVYTIYTLYTHNNVQYIQVRVAVVVVYQPTHWSFLYMIFWYRDLN